MMRNAQIFFLCLCSGLLLLPCGASAAQEEMEYAISWLGIPVGRMLVSAGLNGAGELERAVRITNAPWLSRIYPVDNRVECRQAVSTTGACHHVSRSVGEKDFVQFDRLWVYPAAGTAVFSNALLETETAFPVPPGTLDYVCFFFSLRDVLQEAALATDESPKECILVMDEATHALELKLGKPKRIRTEQGKLEAIPVSVVSKSDVLFSRNQPEKVWILPDPPVVVIADVETRFNRVRATLVRWEKDGLPMLGKNTPDLPNIGKSAEGPAEGE